MSGEPVDRLNQVSAIIEKPPVDEAPSNLAVVGRYLLTPRIFDLLETQAVALATRFSSLTRSPPCRKSNAC